MLSLGRKENFPNRTPGSSLGSNQSLVISLAGQMGGNIRQHAWQSIGRHFEESDCWETGGFKTTGFFSEPYYDFCL